MEVAGKRAYFLFFFHFFCCTLRFSQHLPLGPGNALCGLSRRCPPCRNVNTLWIKPLGSCRTASLLCQQEPHPQWEFKKRKTEVYSIYHTVVSLTCPAECFSFFFFFSDCFPWQVTLQHTEYNALCHTGDPFRPDFWEELAFVKCLTVRLYGESLRNK